MATKGASRNILHKGIIGYFVPDETEQPAVRHFTVQDGEQTYRVTIWEQERAYVDSLRMPWPDAESAGASGCFSTMATTGGAPEILSESAQVGSGGMTPPTRVLESRSTGVD